jgi:hypothetical protein
MPRLWTQHDLAQALGEKLGAGAVLLRSMSKSTEGQKIAFGKKSIVKDPH